MKNQKDQQKEIKRIKRIKQNIIDEHNETAQYLFRIYTEDILIYDKRRHYDIMKSSGLEFTAINTFGQWQGFFEKSVVFEIIGTIEIKDKVLKLCHEIKKANNQESVIFTQQKITVEYI